MSDDLDPRKCRQLALLWHAKAESTPEGDREIMLRVALEYERLADSLEAAHSDCDDPSKEASDAER